MSDKRLLGRITCLGRYPSREGQLLHSHDNSPPLRRDEDLPNNPKPSFVERNTNSIKGWKRGDLGWPSVPDDDFGSRMVFNLTADVDTKGFQ